MPSTTIPRRDWTERTPPFQLTADQVRICTEQAKLGWLDATLEQLHRQHCYDHRPLLSLANSLTGTGNRAFDRDWTAHRDVHMAEARVVYEAAVAADLRRAA